MFFIFKLKKNTIFLVKFGIETWYSLLKENTFKTSILSLSYEEAKVI